MPGTGWTVSLGPDDPVYKKLGRLVRSGQGAAATETGALAATTDDPRAVTRPGVTLTWLLRESQPWRIDRVFLNGPDTTWVATRSWSSPGSIWDSEVTWHRPAAGKALRRVLGNLGLAQAAATGGTLEEQLDAAASSNAAGVGSEPAPPPENGADGSGADGAATEPVARPSQLLDGALWGLAGLVAGVLLTLTWQRRQGTPEEEPEPQDELMLVGPGVDRMDWDPSVRR